MLPSLATMQFRRVNGHLHPRSLHDRLKCLTDTVGDTRRDETITAV